MSWPDDVTRADLRIDTMRGSGAGGQNRNKRDTAVRITHLPTGLVGYAEDQRTQGQNRKIAFRRLVAQLLPILKRERKKERFKATAEVRLYHEPTDTVTDKRLGSGQTFSVRAVVHGSGIDDVIHAVIGKGATP